MQQRSALSGGAMSQPIPRLKDVAEAANVSLSAASRILRGERDRFGAETCERVIAAARRLGWRKNLLVSSMQTGRTKTIGVIIPPYDSFWVGVLSGIHAALAVADYLPITVWVGDATVHPAMAPQDDQEGFAQIDRLLDRRVDGLILWPRFAASYYDHFRELIERRVPVAVIDHESSAERIADSIETDEEQATHEVAEYLIRLGHTRIACVSTIEDKWHAWAKRRRSHFEDTLRRLSLVDYEFWQISAQAADAVEQVTDMLASWRPSAVFAVTDHEAVVVYHAAHELGLRIPEDLSVIGFADLDFAAMLTPPLTTIRQRPKEIGRQAARLIVDRLEGLITDEATTIRVGSEMILRGSTAPPAAS